MAEVSLKFPPLNTVLRYTRSEEVVTVNNIEFKLFPEP